MGTLRLSSVKESQHSNKEPGMFVIDEDSKNGEFEKVREFESKKKSSTFPLDDKSLLETIQEQYKLN